MKLVNSPLQLEELSHLPPAEREAAVRRVRLRPFKEWRTWAALLLAFGGLFVARIPVFLVMRHYGNQHPPTLPPPWALVLIALWVFATFVAILWTWVQYYFRRVAHHALRAAAASRGPA